MPHNPAMEVVRGAGGVVMRRNGVGRTELVVVHRPKYDDWTLPKGKAEKGETDEACALREVEEETSLECELGDEIAATEYVDSAGRPKRVRYFAMTPCAGAEAAPQNEIDEVRWVTVQTALATLTYARDFVVVEAAESFAAD
jgi:8-oxo-dGTP pyrophosphatase MutT (NUDIX family)